MGVHPADTYVSASLSARGSRPGARPIPCGTFSLGAGIAAFLLRSRGAEGWIDLFVKDDGLLRRAMTEAPHGAMLDMRGPNGVPYIRRTDRERRYVLAGGGSAIAPLLHLAASRRRGQAVEREDREWKAMRQSGQ